MLWCWPLYGNNQCYGGDLYYGGDRYYGVTRVMVKNHIMELSRVMMLAFRKGHKSSKLKEPQPRRRGPEGPLTTICSIEYEYE